MVSVAQLVRVPDCDSGCRRFESDHSPFKKRSAYVGLFLCIKNLPIKISLVLRFFFPWENPRRKKKRCSSEQRFKVKIQLFNSPLAKLINKS